MLINSFIFLTFHIINTSIHIKNQLAYLYNLKRLGIKKGLDHTLKLLKSCGDPHHKLASIHIAGTNGKGSTASMLASILRSEGYKVGLYTSPHLVRFNERITINGKCILDDDIASFIEEKRIDIDRICSTFFETTTVMALDYFVQKKVVFNICIETRLK